jgi:hypothetical protein
MKLAVARIKISPIKELAHQKLAVARIKNSPVSMGASSYHNTCSVRCHFVSLRSSAAALSSDCAAVAEPDAALQPCNW